MKYCIAQKFSLPINVLVNAVRMLGDDKLKSAKIWVTINDASDEGAISDP